MENVCVCNVFVTEKEGDAGEKERDFYNYLQLCVELKINGNISLPTSIIRKIDVVEIDKLSKDIGKVVIINMHFPITQAGVVFKSSDTYKMPFFYLDVFNIFPYPLYENSTGRSQFFHEQLLSWRDVNECLSSAIVSIIALTHSKIASNTLNACVYVFSEQSASECMPFSNDKEYSISLSNAIINDAAALAFCVDITRFYSEYYNVDILPFLSLSKEAERKLKRWILLIKKDIKDYAKVTKWYKDEGLSAFSVDLGECVEYYTMENLVRGM